ncbi:hypothetical protein RUND412_001350 [Rhizina undulata]
MLFRFASSLITAVALLAFVNAAPTEAGGFRFILFSAQDVHEFPHAHPKIDIHDRKGSGFKISNPVPHPGGAIPWLTIKEDGHLEYDFNDGSTSIQGDYTRWGWDEDGDFLTYNGFQGGYACQVGESKWLLYFAVKEGGFDCPQGQRPISVQWARVK